MGKLNWKLFYVLILSLLVVLSSLVMTACADTSTTHTTSAAQPVQTASAVPTTLSTPSAQSTQTTPVSQSQKQLKIGVAVPFQMPEGIEIKKWMDLFAKLKNEDGGWKIGNDTYQVQMIVEDSGFFDAAKSRSAVEKLVLQDNVKYLVSDWGDIAAQTATITEPNKVLKIGMDFTDSTVAPKYNYMIRGSGTYFGQAMNYILQKDAAAKGVKTYQVVGSDDMQAKVGIQQITLTAKLAGLECLTPLIFTPDTVDFGPLATKIKNLNPQAVDLGAVTLANRLNLMSSLLDAGYKGVIMPGQLTQDAVNNMVKKIGKEPVEGMETGCFDPRGIIKDPAILSLIDSYIKEYGTFQTDGCRWVTPWFLFEDAVNHTQSVDVDVLVRYLQSSKSAMQTLTGYCQLLARPDLQNLKTIDSAVGTFIGTIQDGKIVASTIVSVKDQYLVSIKAYGLADVYQKYWEQNGKPQFPEEPSLLDFTDVAK